jgi:hypothetical protein
VKQITLLRNLVPAIIVALVLASSLVISAGAKDHNGGGDQCGYGYGQSDNDEGDHHEGDTSSTTAKADNDNHDNDKCEDENDEGDNGGGDGGGDHGGGGDHHPGDRDHGHGPADRASRT